MLIQWAFGRMGVGKTTWIKARLEDKGVRAVLIGQECRKVFGAGKMANMPNPSAPKETEAFVRKLVVDALEKYRLDPDVHTVIFDGMPRKTSQVRWIFENMLSPSYSTEFAYLTCQETVRASRLYERDKAKADDMALATAREEREPYTTLDVLSTVLRYCAHASEKAVYVSAYDTTNDKLHNVMQTGIVVDRSEIDKPEVESIVVDSTDVARMMDLNERFSDAVISRLGVTMHGLFHAAHNKNEMDKMSDSVVWAQRFVKRAIEELQELLHELPEAWWSGDLADVRKARVELIDAWHFIMSASMSLGMDAERFANAYYQKRAVNLARQADGYFKRKKVKGDDDHVARA